MFTDFHSPSPISESPPHPDLDLAESALEGDHEAAQRILVMLRAPEMAAALRSRGATSSEAEEIVGDLSGDCFGGQRAKGGFHRLLGRYNGRCPLPAYLRHCAINRLITLKRRKRPFVSIDAEDARELPAPAPHENYEQELIALLRDALVKGLVRMDPEKLVVIRLIESYKVPQKQLGSLLGWHESKISRAKSDFLTELRAAVIDEVHRTDPWIQLEWEDFVALCAESVDLFAL